MKIALEILLALLAYELLRALVVGRARLWVRTGAIRFVREHHVKLESGRFIDRVWMRERLAWDPAIQEAIAQAARTTGESIPLLRERVDGFVDEIAPYFSISAYYRFGVAVARQFVQFCFELLVDAKDFEAQAAQVPKDAIRVYVANHRQNADPLVLAFGLAQQIALSYAVGEWALVWPLSSLFRQFGSYFVRRGEPDPLYHAVLERFVQLLAGNGAVTGFFVEGALSRDGGLRRPRTGLLEYLIKLRIDQPDREIVFLPVGINYDRVLEDRYLVEERGGRKPKATILVRLWNVAGIAFWVPWLVVANLLRVATRSHVKFGYAAIRFGEPLALTQWPGGKELASLPDAERKEAVRILAEELLYRRIGHFIPATPVPIVCTALLRDGPGDEVALAERIRLVLAELRAAGAPLGLGRAFASVEARRGQHGTQIPGLDDHLLETEEADLVLSLARGQLVRRRIVRRVGTAVEVPDDQRPLIEYYANSIRHHLDPSYLLGREPPPVS